MSYEKGDRDRADPCKIYVGGNPEMEEDELRGLFAKHGTVEKVWIARSPPGFAFVWLTDERDVADAIKALDGAELGNSTDRGAGAAVLQLTPRKGECAARDAIVAVGTNVGPVPLLGDRPRKPDDTLGQAGEGEDGRKEKDCAASLVGTWCETRRQRD